VEWYVGEIQIRNIVVQPGGKAKQEIAQIDGLGIKDSQNCTRDGARFIVL